MSFNGLIDRKDSRKPSASKKDEAAAIAVSSGGKLGPKHRKISAMNVFAAGFLCACGPDKVFIFMKSEDIHQYYAQVRFIAI